MSQEQQSRPSLHTDRMGASAWIMGLYNAKDLLSHRLNADHSKLTRAKLILTCALLHPLYFWTTYLLIPPPKIWWTYLEDGSNTSHHYPTFISYKCHGSLCKLVSRVQWYFESRMIVSLDNFIVFIKCSQEFKMTLNWIVCSGNWPCVSNQIILVFFVRLDSLFC